MEDQLRLSRWFEFKNAVNEATNRNPNLVHEVLDQYNAQAKKPLVLSSLRSAITRIEEGNGIIRNPILLELFLDKTGFDPGRLFGTKLKDSDVPYLDLNKLSQQVSDRILLKLKTEEQEDIPVAGHGLKRLEKLFHIFIFIKSFIETTEEVKEKIMYIYKSWFNKSWYYLVPKSSGKLSADECLWNQIFTERFSKEVILSHASVLFAVYGLWALKRMFVDLTKLTTLRTNRKYQYVIKNEKNDIYSREMMDAINTQLLSICEKYSRITEWYSFNWKALGENVKYFEFGIEVIHNNIIHVFEGIKLLDGYDIEANNIEEGIPAQRFSIKKNLMRSATHFVKMIHEMQIQSNVLSELKSLQPIFESLETQNWKLLQELQEGRPVGGRKRAVVKVKKKIPKKEKELMKVIKAQQPKENKGYSILELYVMYCYGHQNERPTFDDLDLSKY